MFFGHNVETENRYVHTWFSFISTLSPYTRKRRCICIPKYRTRRTGNEMWVSTTESMTSCLTRACEQTQKVRRKQNGELNFLMSFSSKTFLSLIIGCHRTLCKDLRYSFESSLFNFGCKVGCILALLLCHCIWYWHRAFFQRRDEFFMPLCLLTKVYLSLMSLVFSVYKTLQFYVFSSWVLQSVSRRYIVDIF